MDTDAELLSPSVGFHPQLVQVGDEPGGFFLMDR